MFREELIKIIKHVRQSIQPLFGDTLAANGETDWMVNYDGCYANDLGHQIIANRIFEVLAQNCSCLAKSTKEGVVSEVQNHKALALRTWYISKTGAACPAARCKKE